MAGSCGCRKKNAAKAGVDEAADAWFWPSVSAEGKGEGMNRRRFGTALAVLGVGMGTEMFADTGEPEALQLKRNGWMPNNERLPVLLYRGAFPLQGDVATEMERAFERNGWPPQWRNGVYDFHHYHSTAHEVLGFAAGWGRIVLGGEGGHEVRVNAGDVALLPTGTGHCRIEASGDFLVVGAYPEGEHWDICRSAPDEAAVERMRRVRFPASDPVHGAGGPLLRHWTA